MRSWHEEKRRRATVLSLSPLHRAVTWSVDIITNHGDLIVHLMFDLIGFVLR